MQMLGRILMKVDEDSSSGSAVSSAGSNDLLSSKPWTVKMIAAPADSYMLRVLWTTKRMKVFQKSFSLIFRKISCAFLFVLRSTARTRTRVTTRIRTTRKKSMIPMLSKMLAEPRRSKFYSSASSPSSVVSLFGASSPDPSCRNLLKGSVVLSLDSSSSSSQSLSFGSQR